MISDEEFFDIAWSFWSLRDGDAPACLTCWDKAVTLHEIRPRSEYREWKEDFLNSVPVCAKCHDILQQDTRGNQERLQKLAFIRGQNIMRWKGMRNVKDITYLRPALLARRDN